MKMPRNFILWTMLITLSLLAFMLMGCGSNTTNGSQGKNETNNSATGALSVKLSVTPILSEGTPKTVQEKATIDICDYGIATIHAVLFDSENKNEVKTAAWECDTPDRSGSLTGIAQGSYSLKITGELSNGTKPWSSDEITDVTVKPGRTTEVHVVLKHDNSDIAAPKVNKTIPSHDETAVPVNTAISAAFSEAIVYDEQRPTITIENFTLTNFDNGATVESKVEYYPSSRIAVLRPVAGTLSAATRYEARIFNIGNLEIEDMAGIVMVEDKIWHFTTTAGGTIDKEPPTIILPTMPANGVDSVALDTWVEIIFSEPMDPATIVNPDDPAITLLYNSTQTFTPVQGKIVYNSDDNRAIFTPASTFESDALYTVTVPSNVADMAGNPLGSEYSWTFSTNQSPQILNRHPDSGATDVPLNGPIQIIFSEDMDSDTINFTTVFIQLDGDGDPIDGTITYNPDSYTAIWTPGAPLLHGAEYTVTITTDVTDLSGKPIAKQSSWSFTATTGPKLLTPIADVILPKEQINFSWEPLVSAPPSETQVTYQLIISRSEDMTDLSARVLTTSKSTDTAFNDAANVLDADQTYYWCVIAFTDNTLQGSSSQVLRFKTLAKPQAVSPNNGSRVGAKPFDLSWTISENAKAYRIIISENQDLGGAVVDTTSTQDSYRVLNESAITYGKSYYWRVYAVDANDSYYDTYATDTRTFRMFGIPVLSNPEPGSYMPNGNFSFEWEPVQDAVRYHIQVRQQPYLSDNSSIVVDEIVENATSIQIPHFTFSSKADCYWKVSAIDTNGLESTFSGEIGIKIVDAVQVTDINQTPTSSQSYSNAFWHGWWARVNYRGFLFFEADDSRETGLYRTNGIPENTTRIGNLRDPRYLTVVDSALLFRAIPFGETMPRLYQMDTPTSIPYLVENAATYTGEYWWDQPMDFVPANDGHLFISQMGYFEGDAGVWGQYSTHIWVKNFAYNYAQRIGFCDVYPNLHVRPLIYIQTTNGYRLFFSAEENSVQRDLRSIKYPYEAQDSVTLTTAQGPRNPTVLDELAGHLIFFANDGDGKSDLWTSDGTVAGTYIIHNTISYPTGHVIDTSTSQKMAGYLYFWAKDPDTVFDFVHLWRTDGTRPGTEPLYAGENRISAGEQLDIALMNDYLYFYRLNSDGSEELCRTDGETFQSVHSICNEDNCAPSKVVNNHRDFILNLYDRIYFRVDYYDLNNNYVAKIYTTDGTQSGTYAINICGGYPCQEAATIGSSIPGIPIASGGGIYFPAKIYEFEKNYDRELWRYQP